jgi:hypothetical protein
MMITAARNIVSIVSNLSSVVPTMLTVLMQRDLAANQAQIHPSGSD